MVVGLGHGNEGETHVYGRDPRNLRGKKKENVVLAGDGPVRVWGSSRGTITNSVSVKYKTITIQAAF